jgi:hypothetical protein
MWAIWYASSGSIGGAGTLSVVGLVCLRDRGSQFHSHCLASHIVTYILLGYLCDPQLCWWSSLPPDAIDAKDLNYLFAALSRCIIPEQCIGCTTCVDKIFKSAWHL